MTDASKKFDVVVVGAGLLGLSVATAITELLDGASVAILDKEATLAAHQSSHNSGVVHSGLYYTPGSLKARLCVEGRKKVYETCEKAGIQYERSGKLVIATHPAEIPALDELERRGHANGLKGLRRIGQDEIGEIEPFASGLDGLHVPESGVAEFPALAKYLGAELVRRGATIATDSAVTKIDQSTDEVLVGTSKTSFTAKQVVNCAGLQSDLVARLCGIRSGIRIVPFRGEYYRLSDQASHLIRALIYPVPDPRFPFLGVHFTRRVDGSVEVGPNAVLALGREHYRGVPPDWGEVFSTVSYPGFLRLALKHWLSGTREMVNSRSTRLYARQARRMVPNLESDDLMVGGVGVRAQAVDRSGALVDDFVIERAGRTTHVLNAPSPGATASLAIGRHIGEQLSAEFGG